MSKHLKDFADSAQGFAKSPLGIIALFIVLVYGFATLAVTFGKDLMNHITPLIYFMTFFPVLVFLGFLWLVSKHHEKIYGPSDFKDEENFIKMKMSAVASLAAATAKNPEGANNEELGQEQLDFIVELISNTKPQASKRENEQWKEKVLWVDDHPENNIYERKAFEDQGIKFELARSTNEAVEKLRYSRYAAIISDMGRSEGPKEGYVLLERLRQEGNQIPYFIYAGSNLPEQRKMALKKGAQGSTNRPQELYAMVMNQIRN